MLQRIHISCIVGVATALWAIALSFRGVPLTLGEFGSFGAVVTGTVAACWLFDRIVWRWRPGGRAIFHGWLAACPDVRGTWEVELQSSGVDPETGRQVQPIRCFYGVRQTLGTLHMQLMTAESESWLQTHRFLRSPKTGEHRLVACYTNQPKSHLRGVRSEIHHGTIILDFHGGSSAVPDAFSGEYFTDRGTRGTMRGTRVSRTAASTFVDAEALSVNAPAAANSAVGATSSGES